MKKPSDEISVSLDLALPEVKVFPAELELIEMHLGALIQAMLAEYDEAKE